MIDEPAIQPAQVFGIIDPDYARVFTQARIVAWQYGYACLAHGTFTRDLDLLLVPWAEHASREIESIVKHLAGVTGLRLQGPPSDKPHGRKSWSLLFPAFEDVRWVDVSAFAAPVLRTDAATDAAPAAAQQAEPVGYFVNDESDDQWHQVDYEQRNGADTYPLYLHPPADEVQQAEPEYWIATDGGDMIAAFSRKEAWVDFCDEVSPLEAFPVYRHPPAAPQQAEPVAWMAFGGSIVHAVTRNAMDPIEAERFDVPLYLHPPAAEVQRLRDALEDLLHHAETHRAEQVWVLRASEVADIARRALEGK